MVLLYHGHLACMCAVNRRANRATVPPRMRSFQIRGVSPKIAMGKFTMFLVLAAFALSACDMAMPSRFGTPHGHCLYAVKSTRGKMMKWASCTSPPPMAVGRMTDRD